MAVPGMVDCNNCDAKGEEGEQWNTRLVEVNNEHQESSSKRCKVNMPAALEGVKHGVHRQRRRRNSRHRRGRTAPEEGWKAW